MKSTYLLTLFLFLTFSIQAQECVDSFEFTVSHTYIEVWDTTFTEITIYQGDVAKDISYYQVNINPEEWREFVIYLVTDTTFVQLHDSYVLDEGLGAVSIVHEGTIHTDNHHEAIVGLLLLWLPNNVNIIYDEKVVTLPRFRASLNK